MTLATGVGAVVPITTGMSVGRGGLDMEAIKDDSGVIATKPGTNAVNFVK